MLTAEDRAMLAELCERDEAGRHFTEVYTMDWLLKMESLGYITITRPMHETGIMYAPEYWHVTVNTAD